MKISVVSGRKERKKESILQLYPCNDYMYMSMKIFLLFTYYSDLYKNIFKKWLNIIVTHST